MMLALRTIAAAAGWLACVLGAAAEMPLVGPALVAVTLVAHSATLADPLRQFRPVLLVGVLGTAMESAWIAAGAYAPSDAMRGSVLCPLWITAVWLNAAVFVQGAFGGGVPWEGEAPAEPPPIAPQRLSGSFALPGAALVGAVVMPVAYAVAAAVGAIYVGWRPAPALVAAAAYGALITPAAVWLTHRRNERLMPFPQHATQESNDG